MKYGVGRIKKIIFISKEKRKNRFLKKEGHTPEIYLSKNRLFSIILENILSYNFDNRREESVRERKYEEKGH